MRARRSSLAEIGQELNLIPYLDIMVNLVLFMLVTITSFLSFTMLNASIPQLAPNAAQAAAQMKKEQLLLMVRVTKEGFQVDPNVQGGAAVPQKAIARKGEAYDFQGLTAMATELKKRFTEETRVLIIAEPRIIYDDIIHTMDAIRESEAGAGNLFPDVTLSIL
ncbi:MAG TPA: biopolymer transporter ExbD [Bdellovibrionota bacterium]|nr:biopolymer transporter ExbD [Bdellovibrionota bacterium]